MKIPSPRARRDMEMAAELRAAGATWEVVGEELKRHPNVLMRFAKVYREEWERLLHEAEERMSRQAGNESRSVMRKLLRHEDTNCRLRAATELARLRIEELAAAPPPDPHADLSAFLARVEEMSDERLEQYLADFIGQWRGKSGAPGGAVPGSGADAGAAEAAADDVEGAAGAVGPG